MDPYKVLGVTPQTSDDDVKRAYRELARKYHPDNYVNNPLADLAEARMKDCGGDGGISLAGAAGMTAGEHRRNRNRDDSASSSGTMRVKSDVYIAGQGLFP